MRRFTCECGRTRVTDDEGATECEDCESYATDLAGAKREGSGTFLPPTTGLFLPPSRWTAPRRDDDEGGLA